MSKNKRGEPEQKCLDFVKSSLFKKEFLHNLSLEDASRKYPCNQHYDFWFGFTPDDMVLLENILLFSRANDKPSNFPDFVSPNGIMEHFSVTATHISRKGSKEELQKAKDYREIEQIEKNMISENKIHASYSHDLLNYSHDNFRKSFAHNWENHINSLQKSGYKNDICVFLVEFSERSLMMYNGFLDEIKWPDSTTTGDLWKSEQCLYRISRDREMLDYMYKYSDIIKYCIFKYADGVELFCTQNIPWIEKLLRGTYYTCGNIGIVRTDIFAL